jgi:hypothetical protein
MADKPPLNSSAGPHRAIASDSNGSSRLAGDVEIRLRSTERIKLVLQRCGRCSAPEHLLIRIRETLISVTVQRLVFFSRLAPVPRIGTANRVLRSRAPSHKPV